jgi:hypothetical protein|tara:strand:- start:1338 stop:1589 length:252 start_codon:yes stop_codon:yes gene_type:complete
MAVPVYEIAKRVVQGPFIALTHREAEIAIKAIHTVRRAVVAGALDESLRSRGDDELQMQLEEFYENADVDYQHAEPYGENNDG